jgi:hypothetical protein
MTASQQLVGLGHLVTLARGQLDVPRSASCVDEDMNLGRKTSSRASQSVVLDPPFPPAASRCARTMLPSTMEASGGAAERGTGGSGSSCTVLKSCSQIPRFDQLLKRLYTDFHRPYRRGRSRQGHPVRVSQYTALMNRRSPLSERRPRGFGRSGSIRLHSSLVNSWRCIPSVDQISTSETTMICFRRTTPLRSGTYARAGSAVPSFRDTP